MSIDAPKTSRYIGVLASDAGLPLGVDGQKRFPVDYARTGYDRATVKASQRIRAYE